MSIEFSEAKNGQLTASFNNLLLHSSYNPQNEAKRFVDSQNFSFTPEYIVITEPALSYCIPFFREKYKSSKIIVIRYDSSFEKYNSDIDEVINFCEHRNNFGEYFFNYLGEIKLLKSVFIKWEPSSKAFSNIDEIVWDDIKKSIEKAKILLVTRENFEKKWLINSINFITNIKKTASLKTVNKDILIIASGPSLKPLLPFLKSIENKFFIIGLSSAISVLIKNKINVDLFLSTDGGFWAGQHLKKLNEIIDTPLALTTESYCSKNILNNKTIIPLAYNDEIISEYLEQNNLNFFKAERNGTISGTALKLAQKLTDKNIYFAGLDLAVSTKFSHINPNENDINNSLRENKLLSHEKRISSGGFNNESLNIYKNWFCQQNVTGQVFRIINKENKFNSLGQIEDISVINFLELSKNIQEFNKPFFESNDLVVNNQKLLSFILNKLKLNETQEQLFPLEMIKLSHSPGNKDIENQLNKNVETLISKISRILN